MESLETFSQIELNCMQLIVEFLESCDFKKTLEVLSEETVELDMPFPNKVIRKERIKKEHVATILSLLKDNDSTAFFQAWSTLIPNKIQENTEFKKLTIFLYVYFATLPHRIDSNIADNNINSSDSIENLKSDETQESKHISMGEIEDSKNIEPVTENDFIQHEIEDNDEDLKEVIKTNENNYESGVDSKFNEKNSAMDMFKTFLLERGHEFSFEPEFLPYFALPFVNRPKEHPTFSKVFQESWTQDLKSKVTEFLIENSCGEMVIPDLMKLFAPKQLESDQWEKFSKQQVEEYILRYKDVKRKFYKLRRDHHNIVGVASELATALENSVRGEAVDLRSTLENCVNIFPDLFTVTSNSNEKEERIINIKKPKLLKSHVNFKDLDVNKIKRDLIEGTIKSKLLLLQALRWSMTKSGSSEREEAVGWMSRHDLLSLRGERLQGELSGDRWGHPLLQAYLRLLNTLASLRGGRDYLASSPAFLLLLATQAQVSKPQLDPIADRMFIATLQKLSLRKSVCEIMLSAGLLKWLLVRLKENNFDGYSLEYGTSLLMNLILHTDPSSWDDDPSTVSNVLMNLLSTENKEVNDDWLLKEILGFVCGSLYCVLRNESVNRELGGLNLENKLEERLKGGGAEGKQLSTLVSLHRRHISPDLVVTHTDDLAEDELEDPDEIEPEIDADDLVPGLSTGEHLDNYKLVFPSRGIVDRIGRLSENRVAIRPCTPRSNLLPFAVPTFTSDVKKYDMTANLE